MACSSGPSDLSIALSGGGAVDPHGPAVEEALAQGGGGGAGGGQVRGAVLLYRGAGEGGAGAGVKFTSISTDALLFRGAARGELEKARG